MYQLPPLFTPPLIAFPTPTAPAPLAVTAPQIVLAIPEEKAGAPVVLADPAC